MLKNDFKRKIKTPEELKIIVEALKSENKTIVLCHGDYDLLHRGHLHQFEQAVKQGDVLVVSITADVFMTKGPGRPVFKENLRTEMIAAMEIVDFVTISNFKTGVELIRLLKPDVYVKGVSEHERAEDSSTKVFLEKKAIEEIGGKMYFSHEMPIHATPLLNNFVDPYPAEVLTFLENLGKTYTLDNIISAVNSLADLRVLVIGETIIDQYDFVKTMDVSPKGGVMVHQYLKSEFFAGGILACTNYISNFCSEVRLFSCMGGVDSHESFINGSLASNVDPFFLVKDNFRTIVKRREVETTYFSKRTETYFMNDASLSDAEEMLVIERLEAEIKNYDLIFVLDYGHGFITPNIIKFLADNSRFLAVSTQANAANKGFHVITCYPRADYICVNYFEAKLALHDKHSEPIVLARKLQDILHAQLINITLGRHGSMILDDKGMTYNTPVFSKNIVDIVGAGDALFSVTAMCAVKGLPPNLVGFIGNLVGGLATTYIGTNGCITKSMLFNFMRSLMA
ncbi:MAG: adenylyltransferase/cytidyltransferase family protein [Candidatus Yanofskybacteria bacterium]|nr:adenylyltransferase/cytidyltransferase family protein [Candidatus Yanofskybacteria bacterium]